MFDKKWEELTITDNFLFLKVFVNKTICKMFLSRLLDVEIKDIQYQKYPEQEKSLDSYLSSKSSRLDIYCETNVGIFDIEMQTYTKKEDPLPLRSRSYQSNIDQIILQKGHNYEDLKDLYIIFICTFDYVKANKSEYVFKTMLKNHPELDCWDNKLTTILLNTKGKRDGLDDNISKFLDYCNGLPPVGDLALLVDEEVKKVKSNEEAKGEFMTLAQEIERKKKEWVSEAVSEAKIEWNREAALVMLKKGLSLEMIGEITNLPLTEIKKLEEQRV